MKKFLSLLLVTTSAPALAQSVIQSGSVTPGHAVRWVSNGVVGDAGTAASGSLTSLGVTNNGGPGVCVNSASTSGPYNQICLAATTNGGTKISSYAYGGATTPGITFDINGSVQGFPAVTLPVTNNSVACFDGTTGQLKQCATGTTFPFPVSFTATPISINATGWIANASNSLTLLNDGTSTFLRAPTSGGVRVENQAGNGTSVAGAMTVSLDLEPTSGRPWCDVRGKGAIGNGVAADVGAFNACKTALNALTPTPGGTIYAPSGFYCLNNFRIESTDGSIEVRGEGQEVTVFSACGLDVPVFTMNKGYSSLRRVSVYGAQGVSSVSATSSAVTTESLCGSCRIEDVHSLYGWYNYNIGSSDEILTNIDGAYPYGPAHIHIQGSVAGGVAGLRINNSSFDQNWPFALPTAPINAVAWQSTHAYTAGDVAILGGWIIQAMTSGTSGGSSPTLANYLSSFADGGTGLTWQITARFPSALMECGANCSEILVAKTDFSGAASYNLWFSSGTNSFFNHITDSVFSASLQEGIYAQFGSQNIFTNNEILGSVQSGGSAILFESTYTGSATIANNIIGTAATYGLRLSGGSGITAIGNIIRTNTVGVQIDANVSKFAINSNNLDGNTSSLVIAAGTSNDYSVIGNVIGSSATPSDGGSGTNKTVAFNDGQGTVAFSSLTITSGSNSITLDPANASFNLAVNSNGAGAQIAFQRNASTTGGRLLQATNNGTVNLYNSGATELTLGANNVATYWHVAIDGSLYSANVAGSPSFGADTFATKLVIGNQNTGALPTLTSGTTFASGSADAAANLFSQYAWANFTGFQGSRANGTNASKTTLVDGDTIIRIGAAGYDGSAYSAVKGAIDLRAAGTWSGTSTPTRIVLATTAVSSTTRTDRWILANDGGLYSANATGTTQGVDTINAKGIYKDGTLIAQTATSPLVITAGVIACATCGVTGSPLSQFASTTSAQLAGVISDETGSGALVFATSPSFTTPSLGAALATTINVGGGGALSNTTALVSGNATSTSGAQSGTTTYLHLVSADSTIGALISDSFGTFNVFNFRHAGGTAASKTQTVSGTLVGVNGGAGYTSSNAYTATIADMRFVAAENLTSSAQGGHTDFFNIPTGSTTQTRSVRINASGGVSIGATTDPGTGGLYVNGATITLNGLATDATHTDRTVCQDTTSKSLFFGSSGIGVCLGTSGRQFKHIEGPMKAGLAEIAALPLWDYHYRAGYGDDGAHLMRGPTAQDVEKVIPDLARHNARGETINYDWPSLFFVSLKAIQELAQRVEYLERK